MTLATMYGEVGDEQNEQRLQKKLQKMIDSGLLKKLIPRMVDPLKMVRLHALGALRFVAASLSPSFSCADRDVISIAATSV